MFIKLVKYYYVSSSASTVITTPPQNTVTRVNHTAVMFCQASFPGNADYAYMWKLNGWDINTRTHTHYRVVNKLGKVAMATRFLRAMEFFKQY